MVTNVGQVKRGVGMRTCLDEGQLIVAVQQRLRRPGQVLLRPRCVAERPVGADLDGLACGVDLVDLTFSQCSRTVLSDSRSGGHLGSRDQGSSARHAGGRHG